MYSEKTYLSAAFSTSNPACFRDANPSHRCWKPATNRLSYGMAFFHLSLLANIHNDRRTMTCTDSIGHIFSSSELRASIREIIIEQHLNLERCEKTRYNIKYYLGTFLRGETMTES
jgi:hypothetical protein